MPKYPLSFFANNLFYLIADYFGCVIIIKLLAKHDINIKNNQGLDVFKERRCQQQHYQGSPEYSKFEARCAALEKNGSLWESCQRGSGICYVTNKMISSGVSLSDGPLDVVDPYALAFANGMRTVAMFFIPLLCNVLYSISEHSIISLNVCSAQIWSNICRKISPIKYEDVMLWEDEENCHVNIYLPPQ